jgi:hypothetical protein
VARPPGPPCGAGATWPGKGCVSTRTWAHWRRRTAESTLAEWEHRERRRRDVAVTARGRPEIFQSSPIRLVQIVKS